MKIFFYRNYNENPITHLINGLADFSGWHIGDRDDGTFLTNDAFTFLGTDLAVSSGGNLSGQVSSVSFTINGQRTAESFDANFSLATASRQARLYDELKTSIDTVLDALKGPYLSVFGTVGNDNFSDFDGYRASVNGDLGNDHFLLANVQSEIDGGEGIDRLKVHPRLYANINLASGDIIDSAGNLSGLVANIEHLTGNGIGNTLIGDAADNKIFGKGGKDSLDGKGGADRLFGEAGRDMLNGGSGDDKLRGGAESDSLKGGGGKDRLYGEGGNDLLNGGAGRDVLFGGQGQDTLTGSTGNDTLTGGRGRDTFDLTFSRVTKAGFDTITDYSLGLDKIEISARVTNRFQMVETETGLSLTSDGGAVTLKGMTKPGFLQHAKFSFHAKDGEDWLSGARVKGKGGDDKLFASRYMNGGAGDDELHFRKSAVAEGGTGDDDFYVRGDACIISDYKAGEDIFFNGDADDDVEFSRDEAGDIKISFFGFSSASFDNVTLFQTASMAFDDVQTRIVDFDIL